MDTPAYEFINNWTCLRQGPQRLSAGFSGWQTYTPDLLWDRDKMQSWKPGESSKARKMMVAAAAKSLQSCPTLCDPIDGSPPGSPVPGILQARTLEWVSISFSNAWKWKVKVKSLSRVRLLATPWTVAHQAPPSMGFSRKECWSGVPLPSPNQRYWHNTKRIINGLFFIRFSCRKSWCEGVNRVFIPQSLQRNRVVWAKHYWDRE